MYYATFGGMQHLEWYGNKACEHMFLFIYL